MRKIFTGLMVFMQSVTALKMAKTQEVATVETALAESEQVLELAHPDLIGIAIPYPFPCWTTEKAAACVAPFYWDPFACKCVCKQTVECAQPYYFSFEKCGCVCPDY